MAAMMDEKQDRIDRQNYLQLEALGIKRREKIVTTDFKENSRSSNSPCLFMLMLKINK